MSDELEFKEAEPYNEPKEVVVRDESGLENADPLFRLAIQEGKIDALERLIALREKEEERQAKKEFEKNFAEMQAKLPVIKKNAQGYTSKYASLDSIIKDCKEIINNYGFSYRWEEEETEKGKKVTMIISGWGYSKSNSFTVPNLEKTNQMNSVQVMGAMTSYGHRYTFKAGFGISEEGEDTDGDLTFYDGVMYSEQVIRLERCATLEQLATEFKDVYKSLDGDKIGRDVITIVKDKMKEKLSKAAK